MTFPILYKYTTKGQAQQWQIFVDDSWFYTQEGIVGGLLTKSLPTFCAAKNVGRANETTPQEQAILEAKAKHQKKIDSGYAENLDKSGAKFFEPMLAFEYSKYPNIPFTKRTFVQPKLDGLRADNFNNKLTSRNGKPYVSCPHLYQNKARLDGELYNHEYKSDFNKIVSLCKKQKPTKEDLEESTKKVQMWVYDFPEHNDVFSKRYEALEKWYNDNYHQKYNPFWLVPTYEVKNMDEVINYHAQFVNEGYEGTIIRIDLGPYENKRSKQLLKYKDFIDEEFEIVEYEEGEGGRVGTIGFFIMKHDKNPKLTFKSNVKGDFDFLKQVWQDREKYIGTKATVKYFNRTPLKEDGTGNVPRFPYIIKLNREEYE